MPLDEEGLVRVLLFVRPMQPLAAEVEVTVDTVHHIMQPLAIFEPIHQQVFNTRRAVQHRRRVDELERKVRADGLSPAWMCISLTMVSFASETVCSQIHALQPPPPTGAPLTAAPPEPLTGPQAERLKDAQDE